MTQKIVTAKMKLYFSMPYYIGTYRMSHKDIPIVITPEIMKTVDAFSFYIYKSKIRAAFFN